MARSSFGHIGHLGGDRWQVQWQVGSDESGNRIRRTKVIRGTRDDAELYLAARRLERGLSTSVRMTLAQYAEEVYFPSLHVAPRTLETYRDSWEHWVKPLFGGCYMDELTAKRIESGMWQIPTRGAQNNPYALLRQILTDAYRSEAIPDNPCARRIRLRPKERRAMPSTYSLAELPGVCAGLAGMASEPYVLLSLYGGLRREEVCALWSDDVDFSGESAIVAIDKTLQRIGGKNVEGRTKTAYSTRSVPIAGYARERLSELLPEGHLSLEGKPERTNPETVARRWERECKASGMKYVPMKDLRASFASIQSELGTSPAIISRMMGHTVMQTNYAHYQRAELSAFTAAAERMGNV